MASTNDEDKAAAAAATEETKTEEPAGEESAEAPAADAKAEAAADDNKSEEAGEAEASGAAGSKRQREEPEDRSAGGGDGEISGESAEWYFFSIACVSQHMHACVAFPKKQLRAHLFSTDMRGSSTG